MIKAFFKAWKGRKTRVLRAGSSGDEHRDRDNRDRDHGHGDGHGGEDRPPRRQNLFILLVATIVTLIVISYMMNGMSQSDTITYTEFVNMVEDGKVEEVDISSDRLEIHPKNSDTVLYTGKAEDDTDLTARLLKNNVEVNSEMTSGGDMVISILVTYVLPLLLLWGIMALIFRRMGRGGGLMGSVGKSNAKEYVQKETGVTFADVAGEDEAKESLQEVVDFLHNPAKYAQIGAKLPKGALLVGPPGTGKTLLAKAVAGEAHVPFFSLAGSDFIELYVGVGASRVRDLFREATKNAPCIIFIDEIDAIGRSRDSKYGGGNEEREQTLNQLLSEMDGFDSSKGILILGATNRPEILDKALLRPGRFDRRIIVDRPDLKGRIAILKVHSRDVKMDETVNFEEIALATSGAVGSDLANMINEAAINAVKNGRQYVTQKDLFEAVEQVLVGKEKKDRVMNKEERRIVSYHEVGHALIAAVQKNSEPVQKITIVPRTMGALGYVMQVPEEEKFLNTKAELHDMIVGLLGGRAAEELKFETVTTGAANDIERATTIARNMVTQYGMSEKFGLMGLATVESQYLEGRSVLNCSDVTAAAVDEEVRVILETCYAEAKQILSENMDIMDRIAEYLIAQETITGKEFMKFYREVKAERDGGKALETSAGNSAEKTTDAGAGTEANTTPATGNADEGAGTASETAVGANPSMENADEGTGAEVAAGATQATGDTTAKKTDENTEASVDVDTVTENTTAERAGEGPETAARAAGSGPDAENSTPENPIVKDTTAETPAESDKPFSASSDSEDEQKDPKDDSDSDSDKGTGVRGRFSGASLKDL